MFLLNKKAAKDFIEAVLNKHRAVPQRQLDVRARHNEHSSALTSEEITPPI
jgi:hypothetical protein